MFKHEYFECVCGTPEHTLRFTSIKEPIFDDDHEVYVEVYLNEFHRWYRRLWIAIKYVLGIKQRTGAFDCTILDQAQADRLALVLSPDLKKTHELKLALQNHILAKISKDFPESSDESKCGTNASDGDSHEG